MFFNSALEHREKLGYMPSMIKNAPIAANYYATLP